SSTAPLPRQKLQAITSEINPRTPRMLEDVNTLLLFRDTMNESSIVGSARYHHSNTAEFI
ncbi:hypothetical protein ABVT39_008864, partial [Epinephelus coioides]